MSLRLRDRVEDMLDRAAGDDHGQASVQGSAVGVERRELQHVPQDKARVGEDRERQAEPIGQEHRGRRLGTWLIDSIVEDLSAY
ncbi:hypothetical protein [Paractinoplanes tereljensis]|uniref:hypothetical protein n=1 Tax=Paractinoplanes tereljensis TaxID=571912 RepID=UPI001945661F|nr:hypothetical protein [Actinoplanes tereljensis]